MQSSLLGPGDASHGTGRGTGLGLPKGAEDGWIRRRTEYPTALLMLCIFSLSLCLAGLRLELSNQEYPFAEASCAVRSGLTAAALLVVVFILRIELNAFI